MNIKELPHGSSESQKTAEVVEMLCGMNLFIEEEELHVADTEEEEYVLIEIALDSGAGTHVASAIGAPGYTVEPSPGSQRGQNFVAAGGHKMRNKGQMVLSLLAPTSSGEEKVSTIFQVADVTRPLWSVSTVCDAGYRVIFDSSKAVVYDAKDQEVCVFQRQGGLYVSRMRLRNPKYSGFSRPGTK